VLWVLNVINPDKHQFKHLCIFGPKGAIQIRYYYYYYYYYMLNVISAVTARTLLSDNCGAYYNIQR